MMAMLTLNGTVANVFDQPGYKDKATGEMQPSKHRVQIMAENTLQNGEKRIELVNLTVDDPSLYRALSGRSVRVPVGCFVVGGSVAYYALKGDKPEAVALAATGAAAAHLGAARASAQAPAAGA
jgi:hypothetical protein